MPDTPLAPATAGASPKRPARVLPWPEIRSTYEQSTLPVAVIAKAYAVRERAVYERAAREGWVARRSQASPTPSESGPDRSVLDRSVLVRRLFLAVERQIDEIERRLVSLPTSGADEKDARTLAALARTIELLIGLERQAKPETPDVPEADVDELRRELARRIANLQRAGSD